MTWTTADIPNLSGRVALVTGANGGLGLETARAIAGAGGHVVMGARNQVKAAEAHDDILGSHPNASLEITELDLGSLQSVEDSATKTLRDHSTIDILVNNAGVMAMPEGRTADGFETQFGINHLGHWALTARLLPALLTAPRGRVVTVSSTAHHFGRIVDPANPHLLGTYDPWRAYGNSKLANYHFALGLQRQFEGAGVKTESLVAHPGLTNSDLQANTARQGGTPSAEFWRNLSEKRGMTPPRGALSQIRAATDPKAKGGQMYAPRYIQSGPPVRRPILRRIGLADAIDNLWEISERETGLEIRLN